MSVVSSIAIAQLNPHLGNIAANVARLLDARRGAETAPGIDDAVKARARERSPEEVIDGEVLPALAQLRLDDETDGATTGAEQTGAVVGEEAIAHRAVVVVGGEGGRGSWRGC